jgi:hypothetical protein
MPSKRTRILHVWRQPGLSPSELEWLTGTPQEGSNKFWIFCTDGAQLARREWLVERFESLVPAGRKATLESDLRQWRCSCGPALQ